LSKTEAGWSVGIFFAGDVVMVPVLVSLTDRVPARRVYVLGTGLTALSHFGFALFADGFWPALLLRLLAGVGWAGTYMPGLKAIADPLEGTAQSRAVSWHAAGVGISGAASFAIASLVGNWAEPRPHFSSAARPHWAPSGSPRLSCRRCCRPRQRRRIRDGCSISGRCCATAPPWLDHRLYRPDLGAVGAARLGRDVRSLSGHW